MRVDVQHELIERFQRHRQHGSTDMAPHSLRVAAGHYVDPEGARREWLTLFRRGPLLAALSPDLPLPGSYLARELAGTSVLLVRTEDGEARAFVNACRHRGARLAEGRGLTRRLTCPFHAWNYDLEGRLVSRPGSCGGFDDTGMAFSALYPVACLETAGMIFIQLEGESLEQAVSDLLGGAVDDIAGFGIERTVHFGSREGERDCNFKLIMDGFAEAYHIASLHRNSIRPYYYSHPALTDTFGATTRMIGVRASIDKELAKPGGEQRLLPHATTQYLIPPNAVLTHQVDHIQLWQVFPVEGARDHCRIQLSLYWPEPLDAEGERKSQFNLDVIWQVTTEEDFPQSLAIHANLTSGSVPELVFGRNEPALIHYHRQIAAASGGEEALRFMD